MNSRNNYHLRIERTKNSLLEWLTNKKPLYSQYSTCKRVLKS